MDGFVIDLHSFRHLLIDLTFDHPDDLRPFTSIDCILQALCETRLQITKSNRPRFSLHCCPFFKAWRAASTSASCSARLSAAA
jgi:hypothetical protein